jgi:hypothetical protein
VGPQNFALQCWQGDECSIIAAAKIIPTNTHSVMMGQSQNIIFVKMALMHLLPFFTKHSMGICSFSWADINIQRAKTIFM